MSHKQGVHISNVATEGMLTEIFSNSANNRDEYFRTRISVSSIPRSSGHITRQQFLVNAILLHVNNAWVRFGGKFLQIEIRVDTRYISYYFLDGRDGMCDNRSNG